MKPRLVWPLLQSLGPSWLAYRGIYALRMRSGQLRRKLPATSWDQQPLMHFLARSGLSEPDRYLDYRRSKADSFFFSPFQRAEYQDFFATWDDAAPSPVVLADHIAEGVFRYFAHTSVRIGFPPNWHHNPFTGQQAPTDHHWSEIDEFDFGDIKAIWEPNRFGFTYTLVRAYWRTGDEHYPELFWQLLEDWRDHNPPQQGVNWKCGQECSFRVMAWCFGLYGFLDSPNSTPLRVSQMAQMIAVSGQRIEANIGYALSQHNNHGISEGLGLWTIGTLFPEFRSSRKWQESGRRILEMLGRELIYDDGSFVQHSVNYHRLMLHDYLWVMRLSDLLDFPFSAELRSRVAKAGDFLYQMQDPATGGVPYYGQNDGALILPLNSSDYLDFRPIVQAIRYLCNSTRCYGNGPWDEDLLWLFGPQALRAPVKTGQQRDLRAASGGYYTLRSPNSFVFTRCAAFRHRPGQADMLHVDLWSRGQNVALDAGTYSYNASPPWNNPLAHTRYHNTVTVDGQDQMVRAGRFLWLPWLRSQVRSHQQSERGALSYWEGEHDGYRRLKSPVRLRRAIARLGNEGWWLVLDALQSQETHSYRLHWLVSDLPYTWDAATGCLVLQTLAVPYQILMGTVAGDGVYSLVRADPYSPRGWRAPYYYYREPVLSLDLTTQSASSTFWTLFGPAPSRLYSRERALEIETESWQASVYWSGNNDAPLVRAISVTGAWQDSLCISS